MNSTSGWNRMTAYLAAMITLPIAGPAASGQTDAGFNYFYNLEYDRAIEVFRSEAAADPSRPDRYNHLAQALLYRGLYRSGLLENALVSGDDPLTAVIRQPKLQMIPTDEQEFRRALTAAAERANARLAVAPQDPGALYALGVTHGLRSNYDFLVRKAWISAIRNGNKALSLHKEVLKLDPGRTDALLVLGVHDYVLAKLPAGLRIMGAMLGARGNKERGLKAIEQVASRGDQNRVEAQILLSMLYRHERRPVEAVTWLDTLLQNYPRNYLLHFAKFYSLLDAGDQQSARAAAEVLERNRASGIPGFENISAKRLDRMRDQAAAIAGNLYPAKLAFAAE